jgi:hypothetical protein
MRLTFSDQQNPDFGAVAVALLLQLSTIEQIQNALATIKGGYS